MYSKTGRFTYVENKLVFTTGEREGARSKVEIWDLVIQATKYKREEKQRHTVQHSEFSHYFVTTFDIV